MDKIFIGNNVDILTSEEIPNGIARLCFTSPPYPGFKRGIQKEMKKGGGAGYTVGGEANFEMMSEEDYVVNLCILFRNLERVMKPFGTLMLNINSPTDDDYCRTLLAMYAAYCIDKHTHWKFYEHNIWYNTVAPTAAFPYRLKPTWEHIFQFQYIPNKKWLKEKHGGKSWNSQIIFNKKMLCTEYETEWGTQKRKLSSKQERKFSQSGHNSEERGFFEGEGKDLENVFFFANTRNSETERLRLALCHSPNCNNRELTDSKNLAKLVKFELMAKEKKEVFTIDEDASTLELKCRICNSANTEVIGHGAVFPEKLARAIIMGWSNPGDIIIDPFMGSGTVAVACKQFNFSEQRHYIGMDINPNYVALAEEKIRLITKVRQEELF